MPLAALGHLAVWAGLYVAACVALASLLLGDGVRVAAVLTAFVLAVSVYLADRVKLHDRLRNPADAEAHPAREAFMDAHAGTVRAAVWVLMAIAAGFASAVHPVAVALVPAAHLGVLVYASAPRRIRPKDVLGVKNAMVAVCIVGLAFALVHLGGWPEVSMTGAVLVAVAMTAVVFVDAMLCDLEDAAADARHGTRTVPSVFGSRVAWFVGSSAGVIVAVILVTAAMRGMVPRGASLGLAALFVLSTPLLTLVPDGHRRDLVDARLPAITVVVVLLDGLL
ncbi:MAG: UbiA family prenyltransferase [Planctomycetota bacterium]|jgi:4-hydroxybenzoate polyprenyltransferase